MSEYERRLIQSLSGSVGHCAQLRLLLEKEEIKLSDP